MKMECKCGREHSCPVEYIEIDKGALNKLPELCKDYGRILLVSDDNTKKACGNKVEELLSRKVAYHLVFETGEDVLIPDEKAIAKVEFEAVENDVDLIIGVGSGVINDLCKHVSFLQEIPYYIVATAPSMDGYVSVGAALILSGMKITVNARPPKAVIADTDVLKEAPMEMLQAGYGDIIGKYSCLNDWKLSALVNNEYFCQNIYDMTYNAVKTVENLGEGILNRTPESVEALMRALIDVGVAMSYVGNSRPASGSEHHLSHYFEITGILNKEKYFSHGVDVAYSSVITAKLRQNILESEPEKRTFYREQWESDIRLIYGAVADGVMELQDKLGWYLQDDSENITVKWPAIKEVLSQAPGPEEFQCMLKKVGLDFSEFNALYSREKIDNGILYSKDLKDRYTVLWLYYNYFR